VIQRLAAMYAPPSRSAGAVVFTAFIDSLGTGVYLAGASLFFVVQVGLTVAQVGVGLSLAGVAAFASKVPVGSLADRFGPRSVLVMVQALRGMVFVSLAFIHGFPAFLIACIAMGILEGPVSPLTQAVVASVVDESSRTRTLAIVRSARNVAFSLGALVASPLLASGATWAHIAIMLLNAFSFFIAAYLMARVPILNKASVKARVTFRSIFSTFRNGPYIGLAAVCGAMSMYTSVLMIALPLWAVSVGAIDPGAVPVLIAINTVLSVVLQVPLAKIAEAENGGLRSIAWAGVALAIAFIGFGAVEFAHGWWPFALLSFGCVALTIGEVMHTAGEWELSFQFSEPSRRALYLSVFNLGEAAASMVGPVVLTVALIPAGAVGWAVAAGLVLLCAPIAAATTRQLRRRAAGHLAAESVG
jgi:predicted MFS family arabinose efflux permease